MTTRLATSRTNEAGRRPGASTSISDMTSRPRSITGNETEASWESGPACACSSGVITYSQYNSDMATAMEDVSSTAERSRPGERWRTSSASAAIANG